MSNTAKAAKPTAAASPGMIEPHVLYTVAEVRRRLGVGDWAWRKWRRDGLVVLRLSGRAFVLGSTLINFIEEHGGEQAIDNSEPPARMTIA
jgi:hypothetical protein